MRNGKDAGSRALGAAVGFEPTSGEISGPSGTVRLAPQPSALLSLLIEHAGEVVDRDRIKDELWPGGKVEFDQGIAFAVREIRKALAAVGADPARVETLPRRGLRLNVPDDSPARAGGDGTDDLHEPAHGSGGRGGGRGRGRRGGRRRPVALAVGVLALAGLAGVVFVLASGPPGARPVVAVFSYGTSADGAARGAERAEGEVTGAEGAAPGGAPAGVGELIGLAITARTATQLRDLLGVIGPTATAKLSGPGDTDAVRTELGACLVVSGALRHAAPDTVHVFSQIVRTADRVHVWARWDTTSVDEAAERVATRVAGALEEARKAC